MRYQSGFTSAGPRLRAGDRFGRRVQRGADQSAETGPDRVDRVAEHGAGCGAEGRAPDDRVEHAGRSGFVCVGPVPPCLGSIAAGRVVGRLIS